MRQSNAVQMLNEPAHAFAEGDRVIARLRPGFPAGTVMRLMTHGYVLVRWDMNVLETSYCGELDRVDSSEQ